jgi:hypothetical protein
MNKQTNKGVTTMRCFYMSTNVKRIEFDPTNPDHVELLALLPQVHNTPCPLKIQRRANKLAKRVGFETVFADDFPPFFRLSCDIWAQGFENPYRFDGYV